MDDIIIASNDIDFISALKNFLHNRFRVKDLGSLKFFLGLKFARSFKGISLCQRKYALEILDDSGFLGSKFATFPMIQNLKLNGFDGLLLDDPIGYRRLL